MTTLCEIQGYLVVSCGVGRAQRLRVRPLRHLADLHGPPGQLEAVHLLQGLLGVLGLGELKWLVKCHNT